MEEICSTLTRHLGLLASHNMAATEAPTAHASSDQLIMDNSHVVRVLFLLEAAILEKVTFELEHGGHRLLRGSHCACVV
jgi:hypothetical protein